ncbi:MAG TPA: hypothetical protein DHS57_05440 [Erysipelotrichaceae bacterium]|nr:hypothetical protein [Erysipelotrichaceae bacterium]HCY06705.1 hypothetical protein [Erysipelotrichaceae bacterium]
MFFKKNKSGLKIIEDYKNVFDPNYEGSISDDLVEITTIIQNDDGFKTNKKLEIYDVISKLTNCRKNDRKKYARKLEKLLK